MKKRQKYSFLPKISYKLLRNKCAYSMGFTFLFGLTSLFSLGILYVVFDQVFLEHLVPVIKNNVNSTGTVDAALQTEIWGNIDKWMDFWHFLPYILFFVVVVYMFIASFRKEGDQEFL